MRTAVGWHPGKASSWGFRVPHTCSNFPPSITVAGIFFLSGVPLRVWGLEFWFLLDICFFIRWEVKFWYWVIFFLWAFWAILVKFGNFCYLGRIGGVFWLFTPFSPYSPFPPCVWQIILIIVKNFFVGKMGQRDLVDLGFRQTRGSFGTDVG